jgi:hypothetical protein
MIFTIHATFEAHRVPTDLTAETFSRSCSLVVRNHVDYGKRYYVIVKFIGNSTRKDEFLGYR